MGGAQHQHQDSMSDGVHIGLKAFGSVCHTPQVWRMFDVYTRLSGGLKATVQDSDDLRGSQT